MPPRVKPEVAVYARTATDDAAGSGCERQVRAARPAAGDDVTVYVDVARSGNDATRSGLRRLLAAARAGKIRRVLVRDFTRLARDSGLLSRILAELEAVGAVVETVGEGPAHA